MRHNKAGRRLGRTTSHRVAMFRNMVTSLLSNERITTTDAKAKELRSIADKMVTLGKKGDLHAMRQAAAYIRDKKVVTKLFSTIAPRYKERNGGYTRIIKLGIRPGDNAPLSQIELVEEELVVKPAKKKPVQAVKPSTPVQVPAGAETKVEESAVEAASPASPVEVAEAETLKTSVEDSDECEAKAD